MDVIILHSPLDGASRQLMEALGGEPAGPDVTISMEGRSVRIISDHALAVGVCPNFSAYPAIVVDGRVAPVATWADCVAFIEAPVPSPAPKRIFSQFEFGLLFTAEERIAIRAARVTDGALADVYDLLDRASEVNLDLDLTVQALGYLKALGLLTTARHDAILRGEPPA